MNPGALAKLSLDPLELAKVTTIFAECIERSFKTHKMRSDKIPKPEVTRRFNIMVRWFADLRSKPDPFSNERAAHEAGRALVAELSGQTYEPPTSVLWVPESYR